jgi:hypothetical protein
MNRRVLLTTFFALACLGCAWQVATRPDAWRWAFVWPGLSAAVMTAAYAANQPRLVMGKRADGSIRLPLFVVNVPLIAATRVTAWAQRLMSREAAHDRIAGTSIHIGRYPVGDEARDFDLVIDLTAEFTPSRSGPGYVCVANLDGMPLRDAGLSLRLDPARRTLVHCAQGHGRSATWLTGQLVQSGVCTDHRTALAAILAARPAARPCRDQLIQLGLSA